jgi:hypothetical protein
MSFLAPLFLLGGLAVGLPILFHFIRRTTRERKTFSSLMFLLESPPRSTRRTRLEDLLLLALRCAVIGLLALGFARPFLRQPQAPPDTRAGKRLLLLVDSSASMRRADLWSDARKRAEAILRKCSPADQVALVTFDRQINPLVTFDQWNASPTGERVSLVMTKLNQTSPGWATTQLGNALVQAAEMLADSSGKPNLSPARIELITDLQEGSRLDSLQGYEWPKGLEVALNLLKARSANNASLQLVADSDENPDIKTAGQVRIRVANNPGAKREQFKLGWGLSNQTGFAGQPLDVYVPAGQSRIVTLTGPSGGASDRIVLQGDDDDFDNVVFASPPESLRLHVFYLGKELDSDTKQPLYFLKRAFQDTRHETVAVAAHRPDESLQAGDLQSASLLIVTAPVADATAQTLRQQVNGGKTLLLVANTAEMQQSISRVLQVGQVGLEEVKPASYAMFGEINFRRPIFTAFADPRFSDFTKIHFWKYARLNPDLIPGARILARFDSGDPALLEVPLGSGRVLILTSGWQPESSQLALSSKFVPLLYSILETSGVPEPLPAQYWVGDQVPLTSIEPPVSGPLMIHLPDGSQATIPNQATNFSQTTVPGIYTLTGGQRAKRFVVNLDPAESRTVPLPFDQLERLGVPAGKPLDSDLQQVQKKVRLQNVDVENRQKLWRWFIVGTLLVLLVETWLAGRTARQLTPQASIAAG